MSTTESQLIEQLKEAQIDAVERILAKGHSLEQVVHVVENTEYFCKEMRNKYSDPGTPQIACKSKCHWCCHQLVSITAPEALRIARYINENLPAKEKNRFIEKLRKLDKSTNGLTPLQRAKKDKPCAFLSFGNCGIYEARPLLCQKHTSFNVEDCKKAKPKGFPFGSITEEKSQQLTYSAVISGMYEGVKKCFPNSIHKPLELTAGVLCALDNELPLESWLAGDDVFKDSVVSEG